MLIYSILWPTFNEIYYLCSFTPIAVVCQPRVPTSSWTRVRRSQYRNEVGTSAQPVVNISRRFTLVLLFIVAQFLRSLLWLPGFILGSGSQPWHVAATTSSPLWNVVLPPHYLGSKSAIRILTLCFFKCLLPSWSCTSWLPQRRSC